MKTKHTNSEQELEKRIGKIIAPLLFSEPFVSFTLNDTGKRRVAEKTDELMQLIQSEQEKAHLRGKLEAYTNTLDWTNQYQPENEYALIAHGNALDQISFELAQKEESK